MPSKGQKAAAAAKGGGSAAGGGSKPASPTRAKMPKKQADMLDWAQKKLDKPRDDINHHIGVPYDHWDYSNDAASDSSGDSDSDSDDDDEGSGATAAS